MFEIRSLFLVAPLAAACFLATPAAGQAQESQSNQLPDQGNEINNNWVGIAPFIPIPTLALNEEAKKFVRDTEDRQLKERRTLEDKYQSELRDLLKRQADEREALVARLSQP